MYPAVVFAPAGGAIEMGEWPARVREILGGDLAVAFAYRTPAGGVVALPVTTLGMFDADAETVTTTTSFGNWKKLTRIDGDDRVALAYHAREHGTASGPGFVLVQGRASFPARPDASWMTEELLAQWSRLMPARKTGPIWDRLGREYYDKRVPITVAVERIVSWPNGSGADEPEVIGSPLPDGEPPPQEPPRGGTGARVRPGKYRSRLRKARHTLLGYAGTDGFPVLLETEAEAEGAVLRLGGRGIPDGGRRAGLLAHWFEPRLVGQGAAILTGWLDVGPAGARYSPHTQAGYSLPRSELLFAAGGALAAKVGYRKAVKEGYVRDGKWQSAR